MHYHLEIIMPPTDDVEAQVRGIMEEFSEHDESHEDGRAPSGAFWDYYLIGGRFSGAKLTADISQEELDVFDEYLRIAGITVAGLVAGKAKVTPSDQGQEDTVDLIWREKFPTHPLKSCPYFQHGDKYNLAENGFGIGDVMKLSDVSKAATAARVIIALPDYKMKVRADYMLAKCLWNGCTHQNTQFDGKISSALEFFAKHTERASEEWKARSIPQADWLVVTVDYHT